MATTTKSRAKTDASPVLSANAYLANAVRVHGADSPQAQAAKIEATTVRIQETIRRLVAEAPPLPEENRRRIAAVLNTPAGVAA